MSIKIKRHYHVKQEKKLYSSSTLITSDSTSFCSVSKNNDDKVNYYYLKYIVHQWLMFVRLLIGPTMLIYLMPLAGEGPVWHYFDQLITKPCKHNLLSSIFFYSNYQNSIDNVVSNKT